MLSFPTVFWKHKGQLPCFFSSQVSRSRAISRSDIETIVHHLEILVLSSNWLEILDISLGEGLRRKGEMNILY